MITQEEIQERNEQIALMLGWTQYKGMLNMFYWQGSDIIPKGTSTENLKFHSDWNWLMDSLKHLTKLGWNWELIDFNGTVKEKNCFSCSIFNLEIRQPLGGIKHNSTDPIKATFIAVSDFAKLYNEKKL